MPTSRPFSYNTSNPIAGTIQVGNLAVGTPTSGFTGSPKWWNGADEELGYVIGIPVSANTQPTPVSGVTASVGFNRSTELTERAFIEISNLVTGQSFTAGTQASIYLTSNGYWNSYPIAPTLTYNTIYLSTNNPGNSFVIGSPTKTQNDYKVFVVSWEALSNVSLVNVTWGTESADIITQSVFQQGTNAFINIAIAKIRVSSTSSGALRLDFSNNVAAASAAMYTLERYTQLNASSSSTATKDTSTNTLFIGVSQPAYSALIVAQSNISNGATSTYDFSSGGNGSITENYDVSVPSSSSVFQASGAISQNNTNTNYGTPVVRITSTTAGCAAISATFI